MNIVAIVQARMGSSRLPGKVLMPLANKTVLDHVIERIKQVPSVNSIVIATTTESEDKILVEQAEKNEVLWYRGSKENVLARYKEAADQSKADVIVRITSDCPLIDPTIVENVIQKFLEKKVDYTSNKVTPTFPRGLDTEVFSAEALEKSFLNAYNSIHTEHVTPYIYLNPNEFLISEYLWPEDYSKYRWTLDTPEDYKLITAMYNELYKEDKIFNWLEGINLMMRKPEIPLINVGIRQKELGE